MSPKTRETFPIRRLLWVVTGIYSDHIVIPAFLSGEVVKGLYLSRAHRAMGVADLIHQSLESDLPHMISGLDKFVSEGFQLSP